MPVHYPWQLFGERRRSFSSSFPTALTAAREGIDPSKAIDWSIATVQRPGFR